MNVWVVTVGKDESFNSVWVTKKLAWRHAQKMARDFVANDVDYMKAHRHKYSPERDCLEVQGHHKFDGKGNKRWETRTVFYIEEQPVQGDAVEALAEIIDQR